MFQIVDNGAESYRTYESNTKYSPLPAIWMRLLFPTKVGGGSGGGGSGGGDNGGDGGSNLHRLFVFELKPQNQIEHGPQNAYIP